LVFNRLFFRITTRRWSSADLPVVFFDFLVRPFGGFFFSHIGDKIGRKKRLF